MAHSAAFRERLERMEHDRNQRHCLLQAERELQTRKYVELASKLANIRTMEQRCSVLDQKIACQNFKASVLKSKIDSFNAKHQGDSQQLRVLISDVEELVELEKDKNNFYDSKGSEMEEFRRNAEKFAFECRMRVQQLRNGINELQSSFSNFQGNKGLSSSAIAEAEMIKSLLLAIKQDLDKNLASNHRMREHLMMELQSISNHNTQQN
ncbi:hypothetical protein UlMin_018936 [Ulmus minor]